MKRRLIPVLAALAVVSACADKSADIGASYVSPSLYESMTCRQIGDEAQRTATRAQQAVNAQDKRAQNDAAATAVSLILFWPAAFMIRGDGQSAAEVARLKGEMQAIEQANTRKNCGIVFKQ